MDPRFGSRATHALARVTAPGLVLLLTTLFAQPAASHLSLIRQGSESAGEPEAGDNFGFALAVGDFDNDGYDDLATGALNEGEGFPVAGFHGSVVVSYGTQYGLTHVGAQYLTVGAVPDLVVQFGRSLAAGDFDDDGYDDLAVGAPEFDVLSVNAAGAVFVFYGGPLGLSTVPANVFDESHAGGALEDDDNYGFSLASGDFDGDSIDDLAIGSYGENNGAGAVMYLLGSVANGLSAAGAGIITQANMGSTDEADSHFGHALAAGNFLGASIDDVAAGAPFRTVNGNDNAGVVYLIRGTINGLSSNQGAIFNAATFGGEPIEAQSRFGYALAAGRVWGAGQMDLVVGEPWRDQNATSNWGRVVVIDFAEPPYVLQGARVLKQSTAGSGTLDAGQEFGHAVAAGDWDGDGDDDVAVGAPFEDVAISGGTAGNAGILHLFQNSAGSFSQGPRFDFNGEALSDTIEANANLGRALAFGHFDDFGRANLAAGAPSKDYLFYDGTANLGSAGQVYVIAPWRQIQGSPHRGSTLFACGDNLIWSQRPFQRLRTASTAKTLTTLIAAEAVQSGEIDSNYVYTVPNWVGANVGGSQAGIIGGEQVRFIDLMKMCISVSGNDAAFAIGDVLTGGGHDCTSCCVTLPDFADRMNDRAAALGMSGFSNFTNPAGLDCDDHYSTPHDMAILAREAMKNSLFRYICGTEVWNIERVLPSGGGPALFTGTPYPETFTNGYLKGIRSLYPDGDGTKGGNTPGGLRTGLFSAAVQGGRVTSSFMGVKSEDGLITPGTGLLDLGDRYCDLPVAPPPPGPPGPVLAIPTMPCGTGNSLGASSEFSIGGPQVIEDYLLEIYRHNLTSLPAHVRLHLRRQSEAQIAPTQTAEWGFNDFTKHEGVRLVNAGDQGAAILVTLTHPPSSTTYNLAAGAGVSIAPYPGAGPGSPSISVGTPFRMTIANTSPSVPVRLGVEERWYEVDVVLGDGSSQPSFFSTAIRRKGSYLSDSYTALLTGLDPIPGNEVYLTLRARAATTPVEEPPAGTASVSGIQRVFPNPTAGSANIEFLLPRPGTVSLRVFDAAGRLRRAIPFNGLEAGLNRIVWNGLDQLGSRLPSGVYWLELKGEGLRSVRRAVLVR